jgi:uncharacterized protein YdeI (YjbR/CyaY-like superfamily)
MGEDEPEVHYFASPAELRDWFDANHETASELWLGYHRKATSRPTVSWSDAVDEALCVGWIDSIRYRVDDERSRQRFTPRRKGSIWSAINIAKVAQLMKEGRMRPAGLAAFERRSEAKSGVYSYENRHLAAFSPEEQAAFRANDSAWSWFASRPASYRTGATWWVVSAKRDETRQRRFVELVAESAEGRMPRQLTPPGRNPDGSRSR